MSNEAASQPTLFELAGGANAFQRLAATFYHHVAADPVLRPMYPADLEESARVLGLFLMQFCGGPRIYSQERGHPRLRMRHLPFAVGLRERDAWVLHMTKAVETEIENPDARRALLEYFDRSATFMMNR